MAESFGDDPRRYDRTRPRYPGRLIDELTADLPGATAFDVGIGTGVSARPLRDAGFHVLGIEVDARMATFARSEGFEVEVARFEDWGPSGRRFDLISAGMSWHWIDPASGSRKAAEILRRRGRLAVFWNVARPPEALARAFAAVYRRAAPGTPLANAPTDPVRAYEAILTGSAEAIRATGAFGEPRRHRVDSERAYTTEAWLDLVPTFGGHSRLPAARLHEILDGIGAAIDDAGGELTVRDSAVAVTAERA